MKTIINYIQYYLYVKDKQTLLFKGYNFIVLNNKTTYKTFITRIKEGYKIQKPF